MAWLKARPETAAVALGAVGFCYGGGIVNMLATLRARPGRGRGLLRERPKLEDVPKIKATLMIQSAENDERINGGWPAYEATLKAGERQATSATSTPVRSTGSTTTRLRATMPRRQARPGADGRVLQQATANERA